ncbi:ATP-grasp domain-containing protein [Lachnospiraceae bacterium 48-21]
MNVLILAAGTRNKIVQYFREALGGAGVVVATDSSRLAPAIYEADKFYIVPPVSAPGYLEEIYGICKREKVGGVLSLIDPELSLLAQHADEFRRIGVTVIGSSFWCCETAFDKYKMYRWLTGHGYKTAGSWIDKNEFYQSVEAGRAAFPVIVKPARGSASISVSKVFGKDAVELLFSRENGLMVQEFLDGQEIGVDVYVDMISGETVSMFAKKKIKMRAGETDKAVSFKDGKLFGLIEEFVGEAGYRGQVDIDIFDVGGEYYISEVNPRFGGGYPHAYGCGVDHMKMVLNNLRGIVNKKDIGSYEEGVIMMKYNEVLIQ